MARASAAVPLPTATACARPTRAAISASKAATSAPITSMPLRSTASTAARSSSPIEGRARGSIALISLIARCLT